MNDSIQVRGNCQCCGRDQAVMRGTMSKHGYDVEHGYFRGVCQGDRHAPMQVDRSVADDIVIAVRKDAIALDGRALCLEVGRETLGLIHKPGEYVRRGEQPTMVEWSSLSDYGRRTALDSAVWNLRQQANGARDFADALAKIADEVHGQPLREVARAEGPTPIRKGDRRISGDTVIVARYSERGRVYWKADNGRNGWIGTQAWRKLEAAA